MSKAVTPFSTLQAHISESIAVKQRVLEDEGLLHQLQRAAETCIESLRAGGRILFMGNGGSAADAQHLAAELVSRFAYDRPGLPGLALTTDTSILTAVSNDYGYEDVFKRQVEAHGRRGDVLVALSTSGKSPNVLEGLRAARPLGVTTIALTGAGGADLPSLSDICLCVPSMSTARIQECHILFGHILCGLIEAALFPRSDVAAHV